MNGLLFFAVVCAFLAAAAIGWALRERGRASAAMLRRFDDFHPALFRFCIGKSGVLDAERHRACPAVMLLRKRPGLAAFFAVDQELDVHLLVQRYIALFMLGDRGKTEIVHQLF